jgi:hypothetical protein
MKRYGNIFEQVCSFEDLITAAYSAGAVFVCDRNA